MVFQAFAAWLLADLLSGIVHWSEDRLLDDRWSDHWLLGPIKADNDLHHAKPTAMLKYSFVMNVSNSAPIAIVLSIALWTIGAPLWLWLGVGMTSVANLVHRFAHTPDFRLWSVVRFLQRTGFFISHQHHREHHFSKQGLVRKEDTTGRYCPMTNWLNPALDRIRFWYWLERLLNVR